MNKIFKEVKDSLKWGFIIPLIIVINIVSLIDIKPGIFLVDYPIIEINLAILIFLIVAILYSISQRNAYRKTLIIKREREKDFIIEDGKTLDIFINKYKNDNKWEFDNDEELLNFLMDYKNIKFKSESFRKKF